MGPEGRDRGRGAHRMRGIRHGSPRPGDVCHPRNRVAPVAGLNPRRAWHLSRAMNIVPAQLRPGNIPSSPDTVARGAAAQHSRTWTFFEGDWHQGNIPIMGPRTHAAWLGSMVFDGARAFEGVIPDLDLHCARVNNSAAIFHLDPIVSIDTWIGH